MGTVWDETIWAGKKVMGVESLDAEGNEWEFSIIVHIAIVLVLGHLVSRQP